MFPDDAMTEPSSTLLPITWRVAPVLMDGLYNLVSLSNVVSKDFALRIASIVGVAPNSLPGWMGSVIPGWMFKIFPIPYFTLCRRYIIFIIKWSDIMMSAPIS